MHLGLARPTYPQLLQLGVGLQHPITTLESTGFIAQRHETTQGPG